MITDIHPKFIEYWKNQGFNVQSRMPIIKGYSQYMQWDAVRGNWFGGSGNGISIHYQVAISYIDKDTEYFIGRNPIGEKEMLRYIELTAFL
jgi:hypothetical protein